MENTVWSVLLIRELIAYAAAYFALVALGLHLGVGIGNLKNEILLHKIIIYFFYIISGILLFISLFYR